MTVETRVSGTVLRSVARDLGYAEESDAMCVISLLVHDYLGPFAEKLFGGPPGRSTNMKTLVSGALRMAIRKANTLAEGDSTLRLHEQATLNKLTDHVESAVTAGGFFPATVNEAIRRYIGPLFRDCPYARRVLVEVEAVFWEEFGVQTLPAASA